MPDTLTVPIAQLKLDAENPRLDSFPKSQRDALRTMLTLQSEKLLNLAEDIVEYGSLNPAERTIVTPDSTEVGQYVVLEGNRRVAALRLLANPTLADGVVPERVLGKLKKLHESFQKSPITEIDVVVFDDPEDAVHWLDVRHRGQMAGKGIVEWSASDIERWEARRGKPSVELQLLDLLAARDAISDSVRHSITREGITTFRRLLGTPEVREKLGLKLDRQARKVEFTFPEAEVLKGLAKIVSDIATGKISSRTLGSKTDRVDYIGALPKSRLPDPSTVLPAPRLVPPVVPPPLSTGFASTRPRGARQARERTTVFPRSPKITIADPRLRRIYDELASIDAEKFTNAGAVLLRVFLELSLDRYIDKYQVQCNSKPGRDPSLTQKLEGVANFMEAKQILTKAQIRPVRRAVNDDNIAASINSFHDYVHNPNWNPKPKDLIISCDNLFLLFEHLWK
jgi:hypothetical protein